MVTTTTLRLMTSLCIVTLVNSAAIGDTGYNHDPQSRQQWQEVSHVKRGVLVDGSSKIVDVASKLEAIIEEIKNVFKQDALVGDQGNTQVVDIGGKIEAIIDEIKKVLKKDALVDDQGNNQVVDIAGKIEAIIDEIKQVLQTQNLDPNTATFLHTELKELSLWLYLLLGFNRLRMSHEIQDDIDECRINPKICGANSVCLNTVGSYKCSCAVGYVTEGNQCVDKNECTWTKGGPCGANSKCVNTPGSYRCDCNTNYKKHDGACVADPATEECVDTFGPTCLDMVAAHKDYCSSTATAQWCKKSCNICSADKLRA